MDFGFFNANSKDIWKCFSTFKESTFENEDSISTCTTLSASESASVAGTIHDGDLDAQSFDILSEIHDVDDLEGDGNASGVEGLQLEVQNSEISMFTCDDCKTYTLIYQDGQYVCTKCGVMQQRYLSQEAEYRCYAEGNGTKGINPERVGMPTNSLLPESSLGTIIGRRMGDNHQIKRMIQYNSWHQMPYRERSLNRICVKINTKCRQYDLPTIIIERTKELYNIIKDVVMSRGVNRDALIGASTFFACKDQGVPRSQKEIAEIYGISSRDMNKGIQHFREIWRMAKRNGDDINDEISNPIDYIDRYCSLLPIRTDVRHVAEFIAMKAIMNNLVNDNTTPSIAAGSVYLACQVFQQAITKKQVAEACKTSEVTISKCYKKLSGHKHVLLPKAIQEQMMIREE